MSQIGILMVLGVCLASIVEFCIGVNIGGLCLSLFCMLVGDPDGLFRQQREFNYEIRNWT